MFDRRTLPLSALRAFESAALHQHLGRAGNDLGVTHGAISHQIRALEEKLGVKLFTRAHNRLYLTPAGTQLYDAVKEGLDKIIDGTHHLNPDEFSGTFIVACTQTIATSWAAKHICDFQRKYPMIQVHIKEIQPQQDSIPPEVDVAICYGAPRVKDEALTKLASPSVFPVCSPMLISSQAGVFRPQDVTGFPLLHDKQASWNRWFREFDIAASDASQNIYFPNASQALTAARLGYGIALGNTFEIQEFIRDGQLIRLSKKSIQEHVDYYLYSRNDQTISLKAKVFKDWIIRDYAPD